MTHMVTMIHIEILCILVFILFIFSSVKIFIEVLKTLIHKKQNKRKTKDLDFENNIIKYANKVFDLVYICFLISILLFSGVFSIFFSMNFIHYIFQLFVS